MTLYGQDFSDYIVARTLFFIKEDKKQPWIWLGVLANFVLIIAGALLLPISNLFLWAIFITISGVIMLSGLLSIAFKQRNYTSFDRWLKHRERERQSENSAQLSRRRVENSGPARKRVHRFGKGRRRN